MTSDGASRGRSWVAVLAAYLLVAQALFTGLAQGALANAISFDRSLEAALCLPGDETLPVSGHDKQSSHADQGCCTAGCPMLAGGEPAPAEFRVLVQRPVDLIAFFRRLDRPVGYLSGHSPGNPRAPPAFA